LKIIRKFAERVVKLAEIRIKLGAYLKEKMMAVAPNLSTLIGEIVGARLLAHSGSLTSLAKCASSTIQILGAEKALFRALKNRTNTPKYGLLFHSGYITRAKAKDKGRISRYIANKCAIASRIDAFSDTSTSKYGEFLALQVEERLKFLEGGPVPEKNIDVMEKVLAILKATAPKSNAMEVEEKGQSTTPEKKEKSKDKKDKSDKKRKSKT